MAGEKWAFAAQQIARCNRFVALDNCKCNCLLQLHLTPQPEHSDKLKEMFSIKYFSHEKKKKKGTDADAFESSGPSESCNHTAKQQPLANCCMSISFFSFDCIDDRDEQLMKSTRLPIKCVLSYATRNKMKVAGSQCRGLLLDPGCTTGQHKCAHMCTCMHTFPYIK